MKFLETLDKEDIISVIDVMSVSMLYYNGIKHKHITQDPTVIQRIAVAAVALAAQNAHIKRVKQTAIMGVDESQLVRKVERNGRVFGVIEGGSD